MYATAPKTQSQPQLGAPGASGRFGNFATLQIILVQQTQPDSKHRRPDSLDQHVYSMQIEKCLEMHVGESDKGK
jgi:hypothetical protein